MGGQKTKPRAAGVAADNSALVERIRSLASAGLSNKEIADACTLSPRRLLAGPLHAAVAAGRGQFILHVRLAEMKLAKEGDGAILRHMDKRLAEASSEQAAHDRPLKAYCNVRVEDV